MASKIRWTVEAINDLDSIVKYLDAKWTDRVKQNFIEILNYKLDLISVFPSLGSKIFSAKKIRAILVTKHSRLYYRINTDLIIILRIFDTRKDPDKFKL